MNPETQVKYQLGVQDITNLIAAQALELPAGSLQGNEKTYQIRFDNARKTAEELADLVILNTAEGGEIRLGDIARVVDRFELEEEEPPAIFEIDSAAQEEVAAGLRDLRATRDSTAAEAALAALTEACKGDANLMPFLLDAVEAEATVGEVCRAMESVYGVYREEL